MEAQREPGDLLKATHSQMKTASLRRVAPLVTQTRAFSPLASPKMTRWTWVCVCVCVCVCSVTSVLSDSLQHNLLGSSVHGILQARILEWVSLPSSGLVLRLKKEENLSKFCFSQGLGAADRAHF